jgi:predicted metal-dependent HD superfamily phosphohydrolase
MAPLPNWLQEAEKSARALLAEIPEIYHFHDTQHTLDVVAAADKLAKLAKLDAASEQLLAAAAWFHDIGYNLGAEEHEERGAQQARLALSALNLPEPDIAKVEQLILATKSGHKPQNGLESLISDADLSHLGQAHFWHRSSQLRKELTLTRDLILDEVEWLQTEINFLSKHNYHSKQGHSLFDASKQMHIEQLDKLLRKHQNDTAAAEESKGLTKRIEKQTKDKKGQDKEQKEKEKQIGRGVETMYRTTYRTHLTLSAMADNKANIMLSVNAIVISIILSSLVPNLSSRPELIAPTLILLLGSLGAIVFATMSTRPKVTKGNISVDEIKNRKGNLLFFGNYFNMQLNDFQWGMQELIDDPDYLYDTMSRDLFFLGVVLAQKYKYLSWCYSIFMYGLIGAVLSFAVATLWATFFKS